jgi:formamidopyrimidine-DNA glycosylase
VPELPEVEMVARTLRPRLVGRRLLAVTTSGLPLRRPIDRPRLEAACRGATVESVRRVGKYLLVALSSSEVLLAHLGMSGRWLFATATSPRAPHTHVVFDLDDGTELRYVDHRRFGVLQVYHAAEVQASPELSLLGVDPLEPGFTVEYLSAQLRGARRDLKGFLLDQSRIAGIGNIYACEALYHAALAPRRRTDGLGPVRAARLHAAIVAVLERAIANRGTSFSDYVDADGAVGDNQKAHSV